MTKEEPEIRPRRSQVKILKSLAEDAFEMAMFLYPETRDEQRERVAKQRKKRAAKAAKSGNDRRVTRPRKKSNSKPTNEGVKNDKKQR